MYTPEILDHFEHPRNAGIVAEPDALVQIENPACGDVLKLSLKLSGDSIDEIHFLAKGCVCSVACGSALTELVRGKTLRQAGELTRDEVVRAVGALPPASTHAAQLAMDALAGALRQIAAKRQAATP
jgi:nitrogen fixation protein NifU and related proteins